MDGRGVVRRRSSGLDGDSRIPARSDRAGHRAEQAAVEGTVSRDRFRRRGSRSTCASAAALALAFPLILKLASEDASVGITPHNVVFDEPSFLTRLGQLVERIPFARAGRGVHRRPRIHRRGVRRPGRPCRGNRIPDRAADRRLQSKWDMESDEFKSTIPQFAPAMTDDERRAMMNLAERVYELIGLRDYGRVGLPDGCAAESMSSRPTRIPDISVGSGYRRSLAAAGIGFPDFMSRRSTTRFSAKRR